MEIKASIVLPTYNRAWCLGNAIRSALAQTEPNMELIVVDNASTDSTTDVVSHFTDPRVRYYRQTTMVEVAANWGEGLMRARGPYVAFLCDDDLLGPMFLENRLRRFASRTDAAVVFSRYERRRINGTKESEQNADWIEEKILGPQDLLLTALAKRWLIGAALYRRDAVVAAWDSVSSDDLVFDFSLNLHFAIKGLHGVYIPECDFVMGVHPGQSSRARQGDVFNQAQRLLKRLLNDSVPTSMKAPVRRELSSWLTLHGRRLASFGELCQARRCFRRALGADVSYVAAWRSLAQSWLCPKRLEASTKRQFEVT